MIGNVGRRASRVDRRCRLVGILLLVTATGACDGDVVGEDAAPETAAAETRRHGVGPADRPEEIRATELGAGEIGTDELTLRLPDGWDPRPSPAEDLVVLADHPHHEWGRIGVIRVEGLNDVGLYVADTTTIGAALRGLEPELLRDEVVEVPGAREAQLVESVYSAPVEGRPRLRSLQLAVRRTDDLGFDVRIELPEDAWEPGTADELIRSVRLLDAPR